MANQTIRTSKASNISAVQIAQGFDVADNEIVKRTHAEDLVITSYIPLTADVMEEDADALILIVSWQDVSGSAVFS